MARNILKSTLLATTFCVSIPAFAADHLYGGAALGLIDGPDTTASGTSGGTVNFDTGGVAAVFIGKRLDQNWRGEAELARRGLDLSSVSGTTASGDAKATSLMGSAFYDLDVKAVVQPYIGAGVGFAKVEMDGASPFGGSTINDSDTIGAFQAIAGASYRLNDQIDLFADYRYFATADADFTTAAGTRTSMDLSTHSVMAGLRFEFGESRMSGNAGVTDTSGSVTTAMAEPTQTDHTDQVAAQTSAMPSHTLPETYMVHFVLNKADVTSGGIAVIERAAANAKAHNITRLILTGHTDRAGDADYNLSLSKRRAEAVKTAFVALGFQDTEITVKAKGETTLLVPTGDGKHEPQNRRVEIVLP